MDWCESGCLPAAARTSDCGFSDECVLCDGATVFTFAGGCAAQPMLCDDTGACPAGQRTYVSGGPCLPSEPCAGDALCRPQGRACVENAGHASCGRCLDGFHLDGESCVDPHVAHTGPFRVSQDHFAVWDGSAYQRMFLRGVNVGGPRPGEAGSETTLTVNDWLRWMTIWADAGLNVVRVYHLHPPELYDALVQWNTAHSEHPIYLMQGVYYPELEPGGSMDLFDGGPGFDTLVATAIDAVHGHGEGYPDASEWVIGWLIGRELAADEVMLTDGAHADAGSYDGAALAIHGASPTAAWMVARMDRAVVWERDHYASERPIAFTLWPPLDPLTHVTERAVWRADLTSVDLATVDASGAPAGHFISYHAYPYDPDFLSEDPEYLTCADDEGRNPYRCYLRALRAHYADQALLISEFGVPTSLAPAHTSPSGMSQGGLTEQQQGHFAARMLAGIDDVGAAGGIWFQWEDGWWKRSWTAIRRAFPPDRFPIWHDLLDSEQSFGLLAFDPPMSTVVDVATSDSGHVRAVRASASAAVLHLEVDLDFVPEPGDVVELGVDVVDRTRGEPALPSGTVLRESRPEIAIVMTTEGARLQSTPCLDVNRSLDDEHFVPSTRAGGCGGWADVRWVLSNGHARPPTGCYVTRDFFDLGDLPVRLASAPATSRDVIVVDGRTLRIDLAWNTMLVADPSTRSILDDRADTAEADVTVTDGVVIAVAARGDLVETTPYAWATWNVAPVTTERLKAGAETFFAFTRAMPRWLD